MDSEEKIECWAYDCGCGHRNYFMVGGGSDIICHRCWGYSMKYLGKQMVSVEEHKNSMNPERK